MADKYLFLKTGQGCFWIGDIAYLAAAVLLVAMYRRKVAPMLQWLMQAVWQKRKAYSCMVITGFLLIAAAAGNRPLGLPWLRGLCRAVAGIELAAGLEAAVRSGFAAGLGAAAGLELVLAALCMMMLYAQRKWKNEQGVRPLLQVFFALSAAELLVSLLWDGRTDTVFHTDGLSGILWAAGCLLAAMASRLIIKKYFQPVNAGSAKKAVLYPERKKKLELVMEEIDREIETGPVCIIIEGMHGIGKRTFISAMADSLSGRGRKVIRAAVDVSKLDHQEKTGKYLLEELKSRMKEMGLYTGGCKDSVMKCIEEMKLFSEMIGSNILPDVLRAEKIIPDIIGEDSAQTVRDIISNYITTEIVFVTVSGIKEDGALHAFEVLREMKEMLCYPRCIIAAACDTDVLRKLSEGAGAGEGIEEEFGRNISLKPLDCRALLRHHQEPDSTAWELEGGRYVNLADEYEKLKQDMDNGLSDTISSRDTDYKSIAENFEACRRALDKTLGIPGKVNKLCGYLQRDLRVLNEKTKSYATEEKQEFFRNYGCVQALLLLDIMQAVRPRVYRKICEEGFLDYIAGGEWEHAGDAVAYGLLYLYKGRRSPRLERKKQFIARFLEEQLDSLYQESRHTLRHYREMLGRKNYSEINIADMMFQYIRRCAYEAQDQEEEDIIGALFTKVLPWQLEHTQKDAYFAYSLLYQLFDQYGADDYLTPDMPFWAGFQKFVIRKEWQLYDMKYVNDLELAMVKAYVPLSFKYFYELFACINIERSTQAIHTEGRKLKEAVGLFVSQYIGSFPGIEDCGDSLAALEAMVSDCCSRLRGSGITEDTGSGESIRLAKMQLEELKAMDGALSGILVPEAERFTRQLDIQALTEAMEAIMDTCGDYPAAVKGQIENAIERMIRSYDRNQQNEEQIRSLLETVNRLKEAIGSELREIVTLLVQMLVGLHDG